MLSLGIVGLPNTGKSTLFNAITRAGAETGSYPFTTVNPNIGVVGVPDERLSIIAEVVGAEKSTPAAVQFIDIAGLVKGASRGEGLGNRFLSHIREADGIIHVVRSFESADVPHIVGSADPVRDYEIITTELILADLGTIDKRIQKTSVMLKTGDPKYRDEINALESLKDYLSTGRPARRREMAQNEHAIARTLSLLTMKPEIVVINIDEDSVYQAYSGKFEPIKELSAIAGGSPVLPICAELEKQLNEISSEDAADYLESLGVSKSMADQIILAGYKVLDLITFFSVKGPETRAWTIRSGSTASKAAGKIHSDMEKGFIRAEVVTWTELQRSGSFRSAKEQGRLRVEGRDYVVQDGDVMLFRFNV